MSDHNNGTDPMLGLEQQQNVERNKTCSKRLFRKLAKYGMHMIQMVLSVIILTVVLKHNNYMATILESGHIKATYCVDVNGLFDCKFGSDKQPPITLRHMARGENKSLANLCLDGEQTSKRLHGFYWTDSSPNCRVFSQGMTIQGQNIIFEHPGTYEIANTIQLDSRNVGLDKTTQVKHWMNINKQLIQMHLLTVNGANTPVSHLYAIVKGVNKGDVITIHLSNMNYLYTQPSFNTLTIQEIQ